MTMNKGIGWRLFVGIGICCAITSGVAATTTTGVMAVTSLTVNACIVVATPLAFGTLNLIGGSPNDSTATVTVTCTPGTAYNVALDNGANYASSTRQMKSVAGGFVPYALYQDLTHSTPWGSTVGTNTKSGTSTAVPDILTVYGRVPAGTAPVAAEAYLDTVTVSVIY